RRWSDSWTRFCVRHRSAGGRRRSMAMNDRWFAEEVSVEEVVAYTHHLAKQIVRPYRGLRPEDVAQQALVQMLVNQAGGRVRPEVIAWRAYVRRVVTNVIRGTRGPEDPMDPSDLPDPVPYGGGPCSSLAEPALDPENEVVGSVYAELVMSATRRFLRDDTPVGACAACRANAQWHDADHCRY